MCMKIEETKNLFHESFQVRKYIFHFSDALELETETGEINKTNTVGYNVMQMSNGVPHFVAAELCCRLIWRPFLRFNCFYLT